MEGQEEAVAESGRLASGPVQLEHASFHHNAHHHPVPAALLKGKSLFPALGTRRADTGSIGQEQSCSTPQKWGVPEGRAQQLPPAAPCTNLPRQHQTRLLSVPGWVMAASKRGQIVPSQGKPRHCVLTKAQEAQRGSPREGARSWLQPSSCSLAAACCQQSSAGQQSRRCCTPSGLIKAGFKVTEEPRHAVLSSSMGRPTACLAAAVSHALQSHSPRSSDAAEVGAAHHLRCVMVPIPTPVEVAKSPACLLAGRSLGTRSKPFPTATVLGREAHETK